MKSPAFVLFPLLILVASVASRSQTHAQTTSAPIQPTMLLQQSLAALVGNTTLSDVTLSGIARRIAGSDDETGTVVLKARSNGSARLDFTSPSGSRCEVSNFSDGAVGAWSGPDGVSHPVATHNVLTEQAWFFPALGIARRLSGSGFVVNYVGRETYNGRTVEHVSISQLSAIEARPSLPSFQDLTRVEFFLDQTSLLPVALVFNVHPDDNELLDIPVEIRFSDYRSVNSLQVPFHVQKFINNSLILDFQARSVAFNSALSASEFEIQ